MKTNPTTPPSTEAIREYAYHLYEQSGCKPGRDLENWNEATACLCATPPSNSSEDESRDAAQEETIPVTRAMIIRNLRD